MEKGRILHYNNLIATLRGLALFSYMPVIAYIIYYKVCYTDLPI